MEITMLDENLKIKKRNSWLEPLFEFVNSDKKSMIIKCSNQEERAVGAQSIRAAKRKYNLNIVCGTHGSLEIYVVKC